MSSKLVSQDTDIWIHEEYSHISKFRVGENAIGFLYYPHQLVL
jgi:hypothetical protein